MERQNISFTFGQRLKNLREAHGLSHEKLKAQLEEKYGIKVSRDSLMSYEISDEARAKASKLPNLGMRVEYLYCLADFYGVSIDYLIGNTEVATQDYTARKISELTGIDEETIDFFMSQKEYYSKTSVDLMGAFNRLFTAENLEDILYTIFCMRLTLTCGEAVCQRIQGDISEIEKSPVPEAYKDIRERRDELESAKKDIRYARFESIDSYTKALDTTRDCTSIVEKIDDLLDRCANIGHMLDDEIDL